MITTQFKTLAARFLLIALFVFAVVSNVQRIISNYRLHERIKTAEAEVVEMELKNQKLSLLMNYYQSASYQEVEARRRLGMKKPDEAAYIIKGISTPSSVLDAENTLTGETTKKTESNARQWLNYLQGD